MKNKIHKTCEVKQRDQCAKHFVFHLKMFDGSAPRNEKKKHISNELNDTTEKQK